MCFQRTETLLCKNKADLLNLATTNPESLERGLRELGIVGDETNKGDKKVRPESKRIFAC